MSKEKLDFPKWCRELRVSAGMTQKAVSLLVGVSDKTIANCEGNNHKTLSRERAEKLANVFRLGPATVPTRVEFIKAWDVLPISEYRKRQNDSFAARRDRDRRARSADLFKKSLLDIFALLVTSVEDAGSLCACTDGPSDEWGVPIRTASEDCEVCVALRLLGIQEGWTALDEVIAKLSTIRQEIEIK